MLTWFQVEAEAWKEYDFIFCQLQIELITEQQVRLTVNTISCVRFLT